MTTPIIVDYGMGNIGSVSNAFTRLGVEAKVSSDPDVVAEAGTIVLPGVGAFGDAMRRLRLSGLDVALNTAVIKRRAPFLGICLGMQLIAARSEEGIDVLGLNWIDAHVVRIPEAPGRLVPHVGWNEVHADAGDELFRNVAAGSNYYFDHSYDMACDPDLVIARADYVGRSIVAALRQDNILAAQFHPEKSQNNGLRLLRNFINIASESCQRSATC